MPHNQKSHHILRLANVYRRFFSVLIFNVGLENITAVTRSAEVITNKWPAILVLLFVTAVAAFAIIFQVFFRNLLPRFENVTLYCIVLSHYVTFIFPLIHSMFHYRKIYFFWCKIHEVTFFAFNELGFEISLQYFWKQFSADITIVTASYILLGTLRLWSHTPKTHFGRKCCAVFLQQIIVYIVAHALFVVHLNNFYIRLLIKCINLDYRRRASNLIYDRGDRSLLHQLRLYRQFHFKLWEITTAVNGFFGLTLLVLSYHVFIDVAYCAYYIFLYVSLQRSAVEMMSNIFIEIGLRRWIIPFVLTALINRSDIHNIELSNNHNCADQRMSQMCSEGESKISLALEFNCYVL